MITIIPFLSWYSLTYPLSTWLIISFCNSHIDICCSSLGVCWVSLKYGTEIFNQYFKIRLKDIRETKNKIMYHIFLTYIYIYIKLTFIHYRPEWITKFCSFVMSVLNYEILYCCALSHYEMGSKHKIISWNIFFIWIFIFLSCVNCSHFNNILKYVLVVVFPRILIYKYILNYKNAYDELLSISITRNNSVPFFVLLFIYLNAKRF